LPELVNHVTAVNTVIAMTGMSPCEVSSNKPANGMVAVEEDEESARLVVCCQTV